MIIYEDSVRLDPTFPFKIGHVVLSREDNCEDSFHWHNFCEITCVKRGKGNYFVNGKKYEMDSGDLIIFNNVEPHGWMVQEDMEVLVMVFAMELVSDVNSNYLKPFIERGSNFVNKIDRKSPHVLEIIFMMDEMYREYQQREQGYDLLIKADLLRVLTFLLRYYQNASTLCTESLKRKRGNIKRMEEILLYINDHYAERITLAEVAETFHVSKTYFSAYFKKVMNCSFRDYVVRLRLDKATQLIKETDLNIVDIAVECGFNNMSNFYRLYRKHLGKAPTEMR